MDEPLRRREHAEPGAASASLVRAVSGSETFRDWIGTRQLLVRKHVADVTGEFLAWADRGKGRPFFAFLNYYDAHQPYVPPPELLSRFLPPGVAAQQEPARRTTPDQQWDPDVLAGAMAGYDASIASLDQEMERLFVELETRRAARQHARDTHLRSRRGVRRARPDRPWQQPQPRRARGAAGGWC